MERLVLFCVLSFRIIQISSSYVSGGDVTLLRFRLNKNISLSCNTDDKPRATWYRQDPDSERLTLLTSIYYEMFELFQSPQRDRIYLTRADKNTVTLIIARLTESDAGLYFCGTSSQSEMLFEKPIRLVMKDELTDRDDEVQLVTEPAEEDTITASTGTVKLTERVMVFGGVGLAMFVFLLASVVAGGILHCYGWQKGWMAAERAGVTD